MTLVLRGGFSSGEEFLREIEKSVENLDLSIVEVDLRIDKQSF